MNYLISHSVISLFPDTPQPLKLRYFKMDDVLVSYRIMHRYLTDTPRYISKEYPKIKFYYLQKQLFDTFQIHWGYAGDRQ
jgi:hypothetical protein